MKRRDVLTGLGAMTMSPLIFSCAREEESVSGRTLNNVGIQLYTVRDRMAEDLPGTLQRLAEIGFREVEFAGYFDHAPGEIRALLDSLGLASPSAHAPIEMLREAPEQVIETFVERQISGACGVVQSGSGAMRGGRSAIRLSQP